MLDKNFTEMYWSRQYLSIDPKFAIPTLTPTIGGVFQSRFAA